MFRYILAAVLIVSFAACSSNKSNVKPEEEINLELDTDRPGGDYKSLDLEKADPRECRDRCANESKCVAFTYQKPGKQGPSAVCQLKNVANAAVPSDCCVSGVKPGVEIQQPAAPATPAPEGTTQNQ